MPPDATFIGLMRHTVTAPRETAARLFGLRLGRGTLIEATALLAVINGLLATLVGGVALPMQDGSEIALSPLVWSAALFAGMILSASSLQVAGRLLGGKGSFEDALLATVWINAMVLALEFIAVVLGLISADLASIVFLVGLVLLFWAMLNFVRVLHGFQGLGRSFLAILLAGFGTLLGLSFILSIAISLGGAANV